MAQARTVALVATTAYLLAFALGMLLYPAPVGRLLAGLAAVLAVAALGVMLYLLAVSPSRAS